jgi:pimeloyl-ACP methyl ester carboxylesterase
MTIAKTQDLPAHRRDVRFHSGGAALAGTLFTPRAAGPHPAVVMVDGAGPGDRNAGQIPAVREHFLGRGVAVLCYDKPGVGASSGDWMGQSLRDRADEALAAVAFVRGQHDIDPRCVGLWGISQGGWVAPLAASLSADVAFVISVSGPGVPVVEQNLYDLRNGLRGRGHPAERVEQLVATFAALMEAARRGEDFGRARTEIPEAQLQPLLEHFGVVPEQLAAMYDLLRRIVEYGPAPVLERVRCPVLAIFGEHDQVVPVPESVAGFEQALARAGNRDVVVKVFPGADHALRLTGTTERPAPFAPGYLDVMAEWVLERAASARPGPR